MTKTFVKKTFFIVKFLATLEATSDFINSRRLAYGFELSAQRGFYDSNFDDFIRSNVSDDQREKGQASLLVSHRDYCDLCFA